MAHCMYIQLTINFAYFAKYSTFFHLFQKPYTYLTFSQSESNMLYFHVDLFMSIVVLNWPVAPATLPIQNPSNSAPNIRFCGVNPAYFRHITLHYCFMESASAECSVCPSHCASSLIP